MSAPAVLHVIGDVKDKAAVIVDDFTMSGGTLVETAEALVKQGATVPGHTRRAFAEGTMERIEESLIEKLLITDTVETPPMEFSPKVEVVSVAPLLGRRSAAFTAARA